QQMLAFADRTGSVVLFSDTDVLFDDATVYRPDIAVYLASRIAAVPPRLETPPDLVVEVLSPSNRGLDLMTKRKDYEKFGVGEYWVFDPPAGEVRAFRRMGQRFEEEQVKGDQLESTAIAGLVVDLRPIRALA